MEERTQITSESVPRTMSSVDCKGWPSVSRGEGMNKHQQRNRSIEGDSDCVTIVLNLMISCGPSLI